MKVKLTLGLAALACALILPIAASADISGTTIAVNTTADSTGGPSCTLRDAITAANTDTVAGGCSAGNGADTIDFSVSGQISLDSSLPAVAGPLTIEGFGQSITISGQGTVRVLEVSAGASLALDGLTVADGNDANNGGGMVNSGTVIVTNSAFSGNGVPGCIDCGPVGGGIDNNGTLTVVGSKFSGNGGDHGGGIENRVGGTLTISNSSFSGNSAGEGAGIDNNGTLAVGNSSFSENNCMGAGGGIANGEGGTLAVKNSTFSGNFGGSGGGIATFGTLIVKNSTFSGNGADAGGGIFSSFDGTLVVANSTVSENSAMSGGGVANGGSGTIRRSTFVGNSAQGGGGIDNGGTLTVTNSTFSGNGAFEGGSGGGIENGGTLTVRSSTFSGNSANDGGGIANLGTTTLENTIVAGSTQGGNCSGGFTAASRSNLSDDATCSPGFTQVGLTDLKLGPLGDNGGPTQTIALSSGSVAINAGDNAAAAGLITDQRGAGFRRIVNGRVDIGAFEVQHGAHAGSATAKSRRWPSEHPEVGRRL
jgi:CSLREA domain-containing protein